MFKTLYSRMLTTYLSVTLSLLLLLGITVATAFANQYKSEREQELFREGAEIQEVLVTKYLDDDKRASALEELATIARKYDGLMQILFTSPIHGKVVVSSSVSTEKWALLTEYYINTQQHVKELRKNGAGIILNNAFSKISNLSTITLAMSISQTEDIGTILFSVDMSETNKSIGNILLDVVVFCLLGIALAVLAVLYITERMTRPINLMTKTVRQFAKGNYDARISFSGHDEVGELASSFNRMADEVNTLEAARRSFVANVSHELRSPLTSMRGFLVAMQDGTIPPEDFEKYLGIVIDENKRMTSMVNDLLDIARIESGEVQLVCTVFDICEIMRQTLITFEARINAKSLKVLIELKDKPIWVEADESQIIHVLRNLIDNAIKFSPIDGTLSVSVFEQRDIVWACVKDTGKGITDDDLPHIFDRFYKAEKAHTPNSNSGTGLGLSIAKRIIDAHGQNITVKNENGACFMFSIKRVVNRPKVHLHAPQRSEQN